jgi:hypothetical protein
LSRTSLDVQGEAGTRILTDLNQASLRDRRNQASAMPVVEEDRRCVRRRKRIVKHRDDEEHLPCMQRIGGSGKVPQLRREVLPLWREPFRSNVRGVQAAPGDRTRPWVGFQREYRIKNRTGVSYQR